MVLIYFSKNIYKKLLKPFSLSLQIHGYRVRTMAITGACLTKISSDSGAYQAGFTGGLAKDISGAY